MTRQWRLVSLHLAFKGLDELSQGTNLPSIPTRVQDEMVRATSSVDRFLADFPTHILPKINRETTREGLIDLHQLIIGNAASVASNLGEGRHRHLALTMTAGD